MIIASDTPAAQNTNMAASPQPVLEQESVASAVPAAVNDLAADTTDDQEDITAAENEVSDISATDETVTDGVVETEDITVGDGAASVTPLEEGGITEATDLEAAVAADGETQTVAPAGDVIVTIVATDATVAQPVPSILPVAEGEIVETVNEAAVSVTDSATGEDVLLIVFL